MIAVSACQGPVAETVVRFSAARELEVPEDAQLRVTVYGDDARLGDTPTYSGSALYVDQVPIVIRAKDGDPSRRFTVFAELLDASGATRLSWARVRSGFVAGEQREVSVELAMGCPEPAPDPAGLAASCGTHDTCVAADDGARCSPPCYDPWAPGQTEPLRPGVCPPSDCAEVDALTVSWDLSCAQVDGRAFCWGKLERTDPLRWPSRVLASSPAPIVELSSSLHQVCALYADGTIGCGGGDSMDHDFHGTPETADDPARPCCSIAPVPEPPPLSTLVAGQSYTCGLTAEEGALYCTGRNVIGDLSESAIYRRLLGERAFDGLYAGRNFMCFDEDGTFSCRGTDPLQGRSLPSETLRSVATSRWGLCVVDLEGELRCYWRDLFNEFYPAGEVSLGGGWREVALGNEQDEPRPSHRCAIREDGALFCWGNNGSGQLGPGASSELVPEEEPVRVEDWADWTAVALGHNHSCGLRAGGHVYCWGDNSSGQIGAEGEAASPTRVCVPRF